LFLTAGDHVRVDLPTALAGTSTTIAAPLGPDPELTRLLAHEVAATGPADAIVLAAAGSSDPAAGSEVARVALDLGALIGTAVRVGFAATAQPGVGHVVAQLRAAGAERVLVAAYLLAEGRFYRGLHDVGADAVTPPLSTLPGVEDLIWVRFATARRDGAGIPA
jgi:sirohydrochlorin ferrochelatase